MSIYESYVQLVLSSVFVNPRLERLAYQKVVNTTMPGIEDMVNQIFETLFSPTVAQYGICNSTLLELTTAQASFVNSLLKVSSAAKGQMSALAQRGLESAKYSVQSKLLSLTRTSAENMCLGSCAICLNAVGSYQQHLQFTLTKVMGATEFLANLPAPIGPPI